MLHIIQFGKLAPIVRRHVLLELIERLPCQIRAIHQEEHPFRSPELDQTIDTAHRRIGLAAARRHLNQGPWPVLSQRTFQVGNRLYLTIAQSRRWQGRHMAQASPQCIILLIGHLFRGLIQPRRQRFRSMEGKGRAAARHRVKVAGETRLDTCGFIGERERETCSRQTTRQACTVFLALLLDACQRLPNFLGFNSPYRFTIDKKEVVCRTGGERKFTNGYASLRP